MPHRFLNARRPAPVLSVVLVALFYLGFTTASCDDTPSIAVESIPMEKPGLKAIQLLTDIAAVQPGETFTVALRLDPQPGYHTYWKGPGVVGVPTSIQWTLPEGFTASPMWWPAPGKTLMAGLQAYGYRNEVWLLTDISVPKTLSGESVTLEAKCVWMACSVTCHPGVDDLSLTIPVASAEAVPAVDHARRERFERIRRTVPPVAPDSWQCTARREAEGVTLLQVDLPIHQPIERADEIWFYAYDQQVHSDEPQTITYPGDMNRSVHFTLARPNFAPENPPTLSGVLFHPKGWPGIGSQWVEISVPWEDGHDQTN